MRAGRKLVVVGVVSLAGLISMAGAAGAGGRPLSTDLNGAEEVPGPGDANASGQIDLTLNQGVGEVCYNMSWSDVDGDVVAAHIHVGSAGVAGPVVVPLPPGSSAGTGEVSACVDADRELIKAIRQNPSDYYVNLHSTVFPAGAVRGQLGD
jgi:hypothetical protein